jgi:tetratricopeptide (TPR) repeat protein
MAVDRFFAQGEPNLLTRLVKEGRMTTAEDSLYRVQGGDRLPFTELKRLLERGEYVRAKREAEWLIHSGELIGPDLARAYRAGAVAHYMLKELFAAAKMAERALACAMEARHAEETGRALYDLGEYYLRIGDYHLALERLNSFLTTMAQAPSLRSLEAKAQHNLGLIYRARRDWPKAIEAHREAARLHAAAGAERSALESIRGIAWCYLQQEQPGAALPYIEEVQMRLAQLPEEHQLSASLLTDLALYHRQVGNTALSVEYCHEVLVPGRPGVDEHLKATAYVIAGENAMDQGRPTEADLFANLALEEALRAQHPFLMNRANDLRRRLLQSQPQ